MADPSFRFQLSELSGICDMPNKRYMLITTEDSSMSPSASPRAVSIKKKTTQTHKPCIILQSYRDCTDIRPLNNIKDGKSTLPKISPENLIRRSKDLRLALISTGQNPRSSVLSIISKANQQSSIYPNSNSLIECTTERQGNSTIVSPTSFKPALNKSSITNMPDIHQPSIQQQNICNPIDSRYQPLPQIDSSIPIKVSQNVPLVLDEEYVQNATVKCADWLITYVFDKTYDKSDE